MQVPLQITMRNVDHSAAVEERIREKANKLNQYSEHIISCEVVVEQEQGHRNTGSIFNVRLHVVMPRKDLVVNRNKLENLYMAVRDAFDNMARKVEEAAQALNGDVKFHEPTIHGEIVRLFKDQGFGFIETTVGDEYYFNKDNLVNHLFDHLQIGMPVHFIEKVGDEGLQACRVSVRRNHD
ncbi:MAG: 30S ribosomal protein S30 [Coxiella sp. RIFCSPHIGHO2_12_FULL_42_15]|nr:MAG: 30S ribosomal protein S30 [Coxiella sp. RIFCSPHIGHO2_12_FULL_42_15]